MSRDMCRLVDVDGVMVSVRGSQAPTEQDRAALAEVVKALQAMRDAETPEQQAERERRYEAGRARIRALRERAGLSELADQPNRKATP